MKKDYNQEMELQIAALEKPGASLLLHSCCGPCSTAVIERLAAHFAITIYFYNPNIHDEAEYYRRLESQVMVLRAFPTAHPVKLIAAAHDPAQFEAVAAGFEAEPEGGLRCTHCFTLRLEETARLAKEQGFSAFATTLSVSPHKDAERLNQIGAALGERVDLPFLYGDFKKKDGYRRSVALSEQLGLYRQDYCGCRFRPQASGHLPGAEI